MDEVLARSGIFQGVDPEAAEALAKEMDTIEVRKGDVVTLRGKDARQQPYNITGFVLNYGRKSRNLWKRRGGAIKADHYWNQAIKAARAASNEAMRKEAINILNR